MIKKIFLSIVLFFLGVVVVQAATISLDGNDSVEAKNRRIFVNRSEEATWNIWVNQEKYVERAGMLGQYENGSGNRSFLIRTVLDESVSVVLSTDGRNGVPHTSITNKRCGIRDNDVWTMITIVYENDGLRYYRNGVLCDTDTSTVTRLFNPRTEVKIGSANRVYFNGSVDEFKVYDRALSASQVRRLYDESEHGRDLEKSIPALLYHQIETNANDIVRSSQFKEQMRYLKDSGFTPITVEEYNQWKKGNFNLPKKPILITFDDGWQSAYDNGFKVMEEYNFRGTQFIVADYANGYKGVPEYMNWTKINELKNKGWGIEAHGRSHTNMLTLSESAFRKQLIQSRDNITQKVGTAPKSFVFPFHSANETYTRICGEYYDLCFTRGNTAESPAYLYKSTNGKVYNALRRITVAYTTSLETFRDLLRRDTDIKADWRMEEGSGSITEDDSGNNHDASLIGARWN